MDRDQKIALQSTTQNMDLEFTTTQAKDGASTQNSTYTLGYTYYTTHSID